LRLSAVLSIAAFAVGCAHAQVPHVPATPAPMNQILITTDPVNGSACPNQTVTEYNWVTNNLWACSIFPNTNIAIPYQPTWQKVSSGGGGSGINQLTGDGTAGPGTGSQAFTLATVNGGSGQCGDATHVCQVTTNGKGLTTSQTPVAITGTGGACSLLPGNSLITPGTINANTCSSLGTTITISGVAVGDPVTGIGVSPVLPAGLWVRGQVTAANTVTLEECNYTAGNLTPGAGTYIVLVSH
jgi:hypothetical protein